jgi:K(+)-stimulated pyrophosphate-energized sodium pump
VSGVLMGIFQNNAGGAWDNAKKSFEKGVEINGEMFYKKSEPHKASVTGDTVGDPFKDTSGPSMNILIKLMSIVSLVLAPTLAKLNPPKETAKYPSIIVAIYNSNEKDSTKANSISAADTKVVLENLEKDSLIVPNKRVIVYVNDSKFEVNGVELSDSLNVKYNNLINKKKNKD